MRAGVIEPDSRIAPTDDPEPGCTKKIRSAPAGRWNPDDFSKQQIHGLVRQLFLSRMKSPIRQVVFAATESQTDVRNLCWRAGEALAEQTSQSIALVGDYPRLLLEAETDGEVTRGDLKKEFGTTRLAATRLKKNLWLVSSVEGNAIAPTSQTLHSYLSEIRSGFEYSIVAVPSVAESSAAIAMAQVADGIVLVVSAQHTRRIRARKIKENLEAAQACLLGVVLNDRDFPIPERLYHRL